ncbi:MAG TPA: hypothetical protein VFK13_05770 [Gemmatimonadaceae bacterium]|nr:hypothetical protein [Gemmatimonadaceae bacterium]
MTRRAQNTLRHRAYFEQLDAIGDDAHPDFHTVAAGLYALRLFDSWVLDGCGSAPPDARQLGGARRAVAEAPPSATMRVLGNVVEAIATAQGVDGSMVLPALLAYARALNFEARWALAQDVYDTIISVSSCVTDDELLLSAMHMRGYTMRMQGRLDEAAVAYKQLRMAAEFVGETKFVMEARLSEAKLAIDRGNLPRAEEKLEELLAEPAIMVRPALRSKVLHDRSTVSGRRGHLADAVKLAYQALELCKDPASRDRILTDLATTLCSMGQWDGARDAFTIVAATAQEQHIRWAATNSLLEIAFLERRQPLFDQYRRELSDAALPPVLRVEHLYLVGKGLRTFGHVAEAAEALSKALAMAHEHGLNELAFKAETLLENSDAGLPELPISEYSPDDGVSEVLGGIARMLESARS